MIAGGLYLDIAPGEIRQIASDMMATPAQVEFALSRAASRTAGAMRVQARRALAAGLDVRRQNSLRKRLKTLKKSANSRGGEAQAKIWFGLNDLPIPELKGKPVQEATGAAFRGRKYDGGFLGPSKRGGLTIFARRGKRRKPIDEQTYPIKDQADVIVEDEVFPDATEIFMKHFIADLRARAIFGIGRREFKK